MEKSDRFEVRETWLQILHLVVQIWGHYSNPPSLGFILCKVGIIIHPFCWVGVRIRDNAGTLFVVGKAPAPWEVLRKG